jgi:hypothetical protein
VKAALRFSLLIALVIGLASACAEAPKDTQPTTTATTPDQLKQGLTVLEATDTSLSAAYKKDNIVIYFEGVRGNLAPDMYQEETPDRTRYEVDTRFIADNGRLFFTQRGGDNWVNESWLLDMDREADMPATSMSNAVLFEIAEEIHPILFREVAAQVGAERAAKLDPVLRALADVSEQAQETYDSMVTHRTEFGAGYGLDTLEPVPYGSPVPLVPVNGGTTSPTPTNPVGGAPGEVEYGGDMGGNDVADRAQGSGYYYIAVFDKSTAVIARHSATRLYKWNGAWATVSDSCNHGGCPTGSTMGDATSSYKCQLAYTVAIQEFKPDWRLMTCNATGYDAFSNNGHNCHDDTRVQMAGFVYGHNSVKNPGNRFWCNDDDDTDISSWPGDQSGSPSCSSNNEHGYNHKHDMCRTQNIRGWNSAGSCYCDASCVSFGDCCMDGPF